MGLRVLLKSRGLTGGGEPDGEIVLLMKITLSLGLGGESSGKSFRCDSGDKRNRGLGGESAGKVLVALVMIKKVSRWEVMLVKEWVRW